MRKLPMLLLPLALILFSCQPEPKTSPEKTSEQPAKSDAPREVEPTLAPVPVPGALSPRDSARVAEIEEYTQSVIMLRTHEDRGFVQKSMKPKRGGPKDNAHLVLYNGDVVRAVTSLFPEDGETRDYLYLREGKPVYYKYREWYPNIEVPYAKEVIGYFEGDEVIHLQERRISLDRGQKPNAMLRLPLKESKMNRDSFLTALNDGWKTMRGRLALD